jgi:hypothetical protein
VPVRLGPARRGGVGPSRRGLRRRRLPVAQDWAANRLTLLGAATTSAGWLLLRKPAIWIATASPFALYALFAVLGSDSTGLQRCRYETSPKVWMVDALGWFTPVLPMIFGIVLADRLVRHRKLGVAELLDSTPTNPGARLVGKYLGVCAAKRMCPAGASPARSDCSRRGLRP